MNKRTGTKGQTTIYRTLHRKLPIVQCILSMMFFIDIQNYENIDVNSFKCISYGNTIRNPDIESLVPPELNNMK